MLREIQMRPKKTHATVNARESFGRGPHEGGHSCLQNGRLKVMNQPVKIVKRKWIERTESKLDIICEKMGTTFFPIKLPNCLCSYSYFMLKNNY